MNDPAFRAAQEAGRYAPHVEPVNRLVDSLRQDAWLPYVAPLHGGVEARVLSVLRDPGPATQDGSGSGFLCIENDDPTAEAQYLGFTAAGIDPYDVVPWNAYPWYINRAPNRAERAAGIEPLVRLIGLLPHLRVVLLQGGDAQRAWRLLARSHPGIANDAHLTVIRTYHPGRQALFHPDANVRAHRVRHRAEAYQQVAALLRATG